MEIKLREDENLSRYLGHGISMMSQGGHPAKAANQIIRQAESRSFLLKNYGE